MVAWDGEDVTQVPVHRRGFGLVFQDGALFPHRTVAGNVGFGLEMASRAPRRTRRRGSRSCWNSFGCPGSATGASTNSRAASANGSRSRARSPRGPRLLLLDEPLSSLDPELRERSPADVRDILLATGTTAIVVTHDRAEAAALGDRTVAMRDGDSSHGASPCTPAPDRGWIGTAVATARVSIHRAPFISP